jgi:hypothetical protein
MTNHAWIEEFPGAITVCDPQGIILEMNARAAESFQKDGGKELIRVEDNAELVGLIGPNGAGKSTLLLFPFLPYFSKHGTPSFSEFWFKPYQTFRSKATPWHLCIQLCRVPLKSIRVPCPNPCQHRFK